MTFNLADYANGTSYDAPSDTRPCEQGHAKTSQDFADFEAGAAMARPFSDYDSHLKNHRAEFPREETPMRFPFTRVDQLKIREPDWTVKGFIEADSFGCIIGAPGCGKSFIAVDLALSVATGTNFHGHEVKSGPVLFIAGEGHNGMARRFGAWSVVRSVPLTDVPLFKSETAAQFLDPNCANDVTNAAHHIAAEYSVPRLIIVDTLQRNFGAGDENNTQDMTAFVTAMDALRREFPGCTIIIVHHSGHMDKGRARGSIVLKASCDFEYLATKKDHDIKLSCTKMKDSEPPATGTYHLNSIEIGKTKDGEKITSAVLSYANDIQDNGDHLTPTQQTAVDAYVEAANGANCWQDGEFVGVPLECLRTAFYARHTGDNQDAKKKAFQRVRQGLVDVGRWTVRDDVYLTKCKDTIQLINGNKIMGGGTAND